MESRTAASSMLDIEVCFEDGNVINTLLFKSDSNLSDEKNININGDFSDEEKVSEDSVSFNEEDILGYAAIPEEDTSACENKTPHQTEKKHAPDPACAKSSLPPYAYIYRHKSEIDQYFFLTETEGDTLLCEPKEKKHLIKIDYKAYLNALRKNQIRIYPIIDKREVAIGAVTSDGGWQTACQLTDTLAKRQAWDIGTQLGFPIVFGMIACMLKVIFSIKDYKKEHRVSSVPLEVEKEIYSDCYKFSAKTAIAMGAWELGYFIGQCVITACCLSPHTLWIPAILAIGAGLFQAISAVSSHIAEEKYKFGYIKSSKLSLAKIFITTFVSGAVWQLCNYIPFGHLLAKTVIKPAAYVVGSFLVGAVTGCCSYIINKTMPTVVTLAVRFFKCIREEGCVPPVKRNGLRPAAVKS